MYPTRQPITTANLDHHFRTHAALAAAGMPSAKPHVSAIARDVEGELAELYLEYPGITRDELLMTGRFSETQLDRWGRSAATRATQNARRRAA
jgi:hypothetical protein